jgi:hypothetical protein
MADASHASHGSHVTKVRGNLHAPRDLSDDPAPSPEHRSTRAVQLFCPLEVKPEAAGVRGAVAAVNASRKKAMWGGGAMTLADKFHIPEPASIRKFSHCLALSQSRLLVILGIAAVIVASLSFLFAAGHPIISIWAALIIIGWLFVAGAAKVSED